MTKSKIEALDFFGQGITHENGICCFVKGGLPGETVIWQETATKKHYRKGIAEEILDFSPDRIEPACPYYGICGGCSFQHCSYDLETAVKEQHIRRTLEKIANIKDNVILPLLSANEVFGYRNKGVFHLDNGKIGLYGSNSHKVVPINKCLLLQEELNNILAYLAEIKIPSLETITLRTNCNKSVVILINGRSGESYHSFVTDLMKHCSVVKGVAVYRDGVAESSYGDISLEFTLGDVSLNIDPQAFFQINLSMADAMFSYCQNLIGKEQNITVLDLYCGAGTVGQRLNSCFFAVYGIDVVAEAVTNAKENANRNNIGDAHYFAGKTENLLARVLKEVPRCDMVIVDPPRQGMDKKVLYELLGYGAEKILYISCDPATLGRDIKILSEKYEVVSVKPFDLFPRTSHVECVVLLTKVHN